VNSGNFERFSCDFSIEFVESRRFDAEFSLFSFSF
jgi:hypothetical protein